MGIDAVTGRSPDGSGSREPSPLVSAVPASIPNATEGPEMSRLADRLFNDPDRQTLDVKFDWGPGAASMSAEERAAMLNRVFDEMDHPVLGLAAELAGEAMLYLEYGWTRRDMKTGEEIQPSAEDRRKARHGELLTRAAAKLRELAASGTDARSVETVGLDPKDDGPVAKPDAQ